MRKYAVVAGTVGIALLSGCNSAPVSGVGPDGEEISLSFYSGGSSLPDLVIFDGQNYFGKAMYQFDDPLGDIGFRFEDGKRAQAECTKIGPNSIGKDECKEYTVYRSSFVPIPEGSRFERPKMF